MMYLQDIPHLKVYRQKVYLPKDEKSGTLYSIIFMNTPTFQSSMNFINHPLMLSNHKYLNYFTESMYMEKVGNKTIRINYRNKRQGMYETIDKNFKMFGTQLRFEQLRNRNVYYDMQIFNEIFFKNIRQQPIAKKISMYMDYMIKILNNPQFDTYKYKTMVIDVEAWEKQSDVINNPVMYIFLAFKRYFNEIQKLGNINIILYSNGLMLRINPSLCDEHTYTMLKTRLNYLYKRVDLNDDGAVDDAIDKQELKDNLAQNLNDKFNFTGDDSSEISEELPEIEEIIDDAIDTEMDIPKRKITDNKDESDDTIKDPILTSTTATSIDTEEKELSKKEIEDKLLQKISNDNELLKDMTTMVKSKIIGKTTASLKRDEELRKKQRELKFRNMTIEDFHEIKDRNIPIPSINVSDKVVTTNENMKIIKFANFEKTYNDKLMAKDTINILSNLNNKTIPVYITNIDIKDSSDELNYKETYTISMEDENRVRHTIKIDMPKFIEDKFLYLNGNKKVIIKQLFMKPIVKTGPDEVQVCSNYNKIFITRYGAKISPKIEKFKRVLANTILGIQVKVGDNSIANNKYKTTLEYDELAKNYSFIKSGKYEFVFNQDAINEKLKDHKLNNNEFCIGFKDGSPITVDFTTERINNFENKNDNFDIIDYIRSSLGDKFGGMFDETTAGGKRFVYSKATIMSKSVPIILLLGYCEGLSTVLKKANIKHYFSDTKVVITDNEGVIRFNDGYFVYDKYPFENSLLLNALDIIPTRSFSYEDFDDKNTYVELFDIMFGARNLSNAFNSFYEFMIDPITKEVLEDLDYPTDFVSVILFANSLLADNSYITENNMNLYRVRSNEIINAMLHKQIADAYSKYRTTANNRHPVKISIPQDAIIKQLLLASTVEEFSTLNPIYETEKLRAITPKGLNGMNLDDSYTQDKRSYDKTMMGIIGMSTSPDANVGVVRQLTLEPNITSPRGYIDINDDDLDALKDVNLFTPAELLTPIGVTRDDSIRSAMASKQSKHIIPVSKSSPVLISNGAEQVIQYYLSKDFVIMAEDDGEVAEIDDKTSMVIVKYKNGGVQAIDTKPRVVKNSASGFYISNQLNCDLKIGQKIKKNDVLAYENKFFTNDDLNGNRFNIGSLQKVAVMSSYATYEDSTFITTKMSEDMASDIIMMKDVIIGKNANVDQIVKIGDTVKVGDVLVSFETSYEEEGMNKFLASIGEELQEDIKALGKIPIKSKYAGVIEDVKIYSSVDIDELSPTLQKIVSSYYSGINRKKRLLDKYDKNDGIIKAGILFNEPIGKITPSSDGKLKGREVFEGLLIEFYIKYRDPIAVGDKVTKLKMVTLNIFNCGKLLRAFNTNLS